MITMALEKCPRCELNYILDGGELCTVCRREVRGEYETIEIPEMCPECGENPVAPGNDLCVFCRSEMKRRSSAANSSDDTLMAPEDVNMVEIDSVSTMDEIELDIVDDEMASEFGADDEFKDEEEGEDDMISLDSLAEDEDQDDEEIEE